MKTEAEGKHTPTLVITLIPENTGHLAFVNGKTYSKEEVLCAVNCHEEIINALKDAIIDLNSIYNHAAVYGDFVVSLGKYRRLNSMKQAIAKAEAL